MNNLGQNQKPIYFVIAIIFILVGGVAGYFIGTMNDSTELDKYKAAVDILYPPLPDEIFSITGTIKSIDGTIIIEAYSLEERTLPGEEVNMIDVTINLGSETQIVKQSLDISGETVDIKETPLTLGDLEVGDIISTQADENIKHKTEFTATKIILME